MNLLDVSIENFLAYQGAVVVSLAKCGLTLIEGPNGAGKSAIAEAIVWCLTGKTLRGYEGDEVVNHRVGKDCSVELRLTDRGGRVLRVARHRLHAHHKNKLVLTRPDTAEDITQGTNQATQERLDKLVGVTFDTLVACLVFAQGARFRFASLTDREQKAILDEVLGTEQYARAWKLAREELGAAKGVLVESRARQLSMEDQLQTAHQEARDLRVKEEGFAEVQRERVRALRKKAAAEEKSAPAPVRGPVEVLSDVKKAVAQLAEAYSDGGKALRKVSDDVSAAKQVLKVANQALLEHQKLVSHGKCPTCRQSLDRELQGDRERALKKAVVVETGKQAQVGIQLEKAEAYYEEARRRFSEMDEHYRELLVLQADATAANESRASAKRRAKELNRQADEEAARENPYAELIIKVDARAAKIQGDLLEIDKLITRTARTTELLSFWADGFSASGLRSLLVDSALPVLNAAAARYAAALLDGATIEFRNQVELKSGERRERFEVAVSAARGAESYAGLSAGERARADLCVGMALQELVASRSKTRFNVAFFDEPTATIDQDSHERVVELLGSLDLDSVFVMAHDEGLKAYFPNVLEVRRGEDGGSVVE